MLRKVRELFGGRLELALTGAAPIPREVLEFLDACGITVLEGYGMTETCAAATLNPPHDPRFGTVGPALPGFDGRDRRGRRDPARRAERVQGLPPQRGGDAPRRSSATSCAPATSASSTDGYLRITGRKKDLIITSSGKNISPTNIENALRESRWISQAVVHGDNRSYLVALLTLDPDEAAALAEELGIDGGDVRAMAADRARARGAPAGRRPGQRAVRADRAGQEVHRARGGPQPGGRAS